MFYLLSRLVSTTAGSLYPAYASYKAIKSNDLQKLEVWLMYWVVMGFIMCMESTVEWLFAWFPFYYECKTLVILWLTLPQIQGSTYIYVAHVHPFLSSHEEDIDAAVADAKGRAKRAGLEWLNKAVQRVKEVVVGGLVSQSLEAAGVDQQQGDGSGQQQQQPTGPPPAYDHQPSTSATSGLYNLAGNYLRQYGPAAVAAGTALLHPMNGRQPSVRAANTSSTRTDQQRSLGLGHSSSEPIVPIANGGSTTSLRTRDEARRRRAELEAELAAIHSDTTSSSSFADSSPPPSAHSTRSASSAAAPPNQYAATTRIYHPSAAGSSTAHPRSASAGHPASLTPGSGLGLGGKRAPSPSSQLGASGLGFEEIGRDELGDYARVGAGERSTAAAGGGGWWKWGAGQPGAAAAGGVGEERKNA